MTVSGAGLKGVPLVSSPSDENSGSTISAVQLINVSQITATDAIADDGDMIKITGDECINVVIGVLVILLVLIVVAGIAKSIISVNSRPKSDLLDVENSTLSAHHVRCRWPTVDNPLLSPDSLYDISELERNKRLVS